MSIEKIHKGFKNQNLLKNDYIGDNKNART